MKYWVLSISGLLLMMAFQNFSHAPIESEELNMDNLVEEAIKAELAPVETEPVQKVVPKKKKKVPVPTRDTQTTASTFDPIEYVDSRMAKMTDEQIESEEETLLKDLEERISDDIKYNSL